MLNVDYDATVVMGVEQGALMSPNQRGKLEHLAVGCVCCLVVFEMLIHSLR